MVYVYIDIYPLCKMRRNVVTYTPPVIPLNIL